MERSLYPFQEALELFTYLLKNHSDENDEERKANMLAVEAQLAARGVKTVSVSN